MCITCGCSGASHHHHHEHDHKQGHSHDCGDARAPLAAVHHHETGAARALEVEQDILGENNRYAARNRDLFDAHGIVALNLMSSPGAGKTTLLTRTLASGRFKAGVVEGDQSTNLDAQRIRATGAPVVQINTGAGCHLDGHMVGHALEDLGVSSGALDGGVVLIENVGNLVCPAAFDLGEAAKVVLLSITEGEDKPLKYPIMFAAADIVVLTKIDLLPHVAFDVERCLGYAREVNKDVETLCLSSTTGEGMDAWLAWINGLYSRGGENPSSSTP